MGFHSCEYCIEGDSEMSSGEVILEFKNGHSYIMPDMILHYIADHKYLPPREFIDDVLYADPLCGRRLQTKGMQVPIGYLSGPFKKGQVPERFFEYLWSLIRQANKNGFRVGTRGL